MDKKATPAPTINCKGTLIDFSQPRIMGILNLTPDSFYAGSRYLSANDVVKQADRMLEQGADFLDIGAASSRPGAAEVTVSEEWQRLQPVLEALAAHFPDALVSVDTYHAEIARRAVQDYGVALINDISAGTLDKHMFATMADLQVPYIIMHMQGTPRTMQSNPQYDNLIKDIVRYLAEKINQLRLLGVNDIIADPGFGFGKTLQHNYQLLEKLDAFRILERPLLVGLSRKSMIYKLLNTTPQEALNGTTALHTIALLKGASILRVHDVPAAREVVQLTQFYKQAHSA